MKKLIRIFEVKRGQRLSERDRNILMEILDTNLCQSCRVQKGDFQICTGCIIELNRLREFQEYD